MHERAQSESDPWSIRIVYLDSSPGSPAEIFPITSYLILFAAGGRDQTGDLPHAKQMQFTESWPLPIDHNLESIILIQQTGLSYHRTDCK